MERRVLLAITLSFLVLFLFQRFVAPPPASAPPASVNGTSAGQAPAPAPAGGATPAPPLPAAAAAAPQPDAAGNATPSGPTVTIGDTDEREIVVDTARVRAVFSNRGGVIVRWILKEYRDNHGELLDLVPASAGAGRKPFTLTVDDAASSARMSDALYRVSVNGGPAAPSVDATTAGQTIQFDLETSDGLTVKKTFAIEPTTFVIGFGADVRAGQQQLNPTIHWGPGVSDDIAVAPPASFFSPAYTLPAQGIYYLDGGVERIDPSAAGAIEGTYRYAGVDDHYFVTLLVNEQSRAFRMEYAPVTVPQPGAGVNGRYVGYAIRFQQPQPEARFFFGPKVFEDLRGVHPEYTRAIYFGIFSWLAVPLLNALKWVHGFIGNWGWSIVVLTILINLAMFPLRHKSVVSMKKMQEIQPQMKAIQERYAKYKITDPERQKMNTEVMELYKAKGVNPASGCVPMLLTFPFLFAFYAMLSVAIEIRGAHFFGWITNLSAPDPYFITPILMGAAQFWQTKMTPTSADPTQQKIMMFMPIMFTVMSLSFPSGLVIYWLVSTVFTIAQQYLTTHLAGAKAKAGAK